MKSDAGKVRAEASLRSGDSKVGRESQPAPTPDRGALHGCYHWQRSSEESERRSIQSWNVFVPVGGEIQSSTEVPPFGREHDDAAPIGPFQLLVCGSQCLNERGVE